MLIIPLHKMHTLILCKTDVLSPLRSIHIPDKKRNAPLRTVQLSGRSQVQRYVRYCCVTCLLQSSVEIVLKTIGHEQSGGQIVKSQEISVFIVLSCWISSSHWNHLSRLNCTHTLILCKFYL